MLPVRSVAHMLKQGAHKLLKALCLGCFYSLDTLLRVLQMKGFPTPSREPDASRGNQAEARILGLDATVKRVRAETSTSQGKSGIGEVGMRRQLGRVTS